MTQALRVVLTAGEPALKTTLSSREKAQQRQAVDLLQQHCQSLQAWGTSLEVDLDLPGSTTLTPRQRQALGARTDHKRLIQAAHSVLDMYKTHMNNSVVLGGV